MRGVERWGNGVAVAVLIGSMVAFTPLPVFADESYHPEPDRVVIVHDPDHPNQFTVTAEYSVNSVEAGIERPGAAARRARKRDHAHARRKRTHRAQVAGTGMPVVLDSNRGGHDRQASTDPHGGGQRQSGNAPAHAVTSQRVGNLLLTTFACPVARERENAPAAD